MFCQLVCLILSISCPATCSCCFTCRSCACSPRIPLLHFNTPKVPFHSQRTTCTKKAKKSPKKNKMKNMVRDNIYFFKKIMYTIQRVVFKKLTTCHTVIIVIPFSLPSRYHIALCVHLHTSYLHTSLIFCVLYLFCTSN